MPMLIYQNNYIKQSYFDRETSEERERERERERVRCSKGGMLLRGLYHFDQCLRKPSKESDKQLHCN
jgi:hypothetical protein